MDFTHKQKSAKLPWHHNFGHSWGQSWYRSWGGSGVSRMVSKRSTIGSSQLSNGNFLIQILKRHHHSLYHHHKGKGIELPSGQLKMWESKFRVGTVLPQTGKVSESIAFSKTKWESGLGLITSVKLSFKFYLVLHLHLFCLGVIPFYCQRLPKIFHLSAP